MVGYLPGVYEDIGSFLFIENHHLLLGRGNIPVQTVQGNTSQQSLSWQGGKGGKGERLGEEGGKVREGLEEGEGEGEMEWRYVQLEWQNIHPEHTS